MSSSRLPGKVLLDLAGQPMLVRVAERSRQAKTIHNVVIATTTEASDDPIEHLCAERGYPFYRGSQHDVLDRYYQAARTFGAEIIVRITADCPMMDPEVVDRVIGLLGNGRSEFGQSGVPDSRFTSDGTSSNVPSAFPSPDFAASRLPPPWGRTLPIGLDVEVVSFTALERAWKEASQPFQREHVMPYFYEGILAEALAPKRPGCPPENAQHTSHDPWFVSRATSPRGFRVAQLHHFPDYGDRRWTVDTPADLELLRQIFTRFDGRDDFTWYDVLALFEREPELAAINANTLHKTAFDVDHRTA